MKISPAHLLATLFIAEIQAQSLPPNSCAAVAATAVPKCAQSCFINNAPSVGCGGLDFACQCEKKASFFAAVEGCVGSSCQSSEFQKVIDGASSGMMTSTPKRWVEQNASWVLTLNRTKSSL